MSAAPAAVTGDVITVTASRELQVVAKINEHHRLAEESYMEHAIEAGRLLLEQKKRVGYGNFGRWIATNCGFSHATANNYMFAAKLAEENPNALGKAIRHRFPSGRTPGREALPAPSEVQRPALEAPSAAAIGAVTGDELSIEPAIAVLEADGTTDSRRRLKELTRARQAVKEARRRLERSEIRERNAEASILAAARRLREAHE